MKQIYLDNAATAFPKAPGVAESMCNYITNIGCNINRGAYSSSYSAEEIVFETRELIGNVFNFNKPENVIFTKNITESLNIIIKGLFKTGDHVIVSSMEHNAVMRPLNSILKNGVEFSRVQCNNLGELDILDIAQHIKPNTKAIIMTRCGLHCAPSAHKTLGTFPNGTVRFSFSHSNSKEDVLYTIDAINKCIKDFP